MDKELWAKMEDLLDKYQVKPMVGVIPHNEDPKLNIYPEDPNFWQVVKQWEEKGWTIAMHGYNHVYSTNNGGINPLWKKSEFAGNTLEIQRDKVRKGVSLLHEHGLNPHYFFAPSHTFDENTLMALELESDIRIISDTIASKPYKKGKFVFIPQQSGHPIKLPFGGIVTICYHPNTMKEDSFARFEDFLNKESIDVLSFDRVILTEIKNKNLVDKLLSTFYFLKRRF